LGGYPIGRVTEIQPPALKKDLDTGKIYYQVLLVLSIDDQFHQIPADSEIKVMTRGLGSSFIEIRVNPQKTQPTAISEKGEFLKNGTKIQGSVGMTSEFLPAESQKKIDRLVDEMTILLGNANAIVGDPNNKENVKKTLANLSQATAEITQNLNELQGFLANAKIMSQDMGDFINQMQLIADKVNSGNGTAAKFLNDGRLYENLVVSTQQLDDLMEELKKLVAEYRQKGIRIKF
jgi:ABC-type transporter Mla subunit MlaD